MNRIRRFVLPLAPLLLLLSALAVVATFAIDRLMIHWSINDLTLRGKLIASLLEPTIEQSVHTKDNSALRQRFERTIRDERLHSLALCDTTDKTLAATELFRRITHCRLRPIENPVEIVSREDVTFHVQRLPVGDESNTLMLILVHDMSFVDQRSWKARMGSFAFFLVLGLSTVGLVGLLYRSTLGGILRDLRSTIRNRNPTIGGDPAISREFLPILREMRSFVRETENRYQGLFTDRGIWSADTLRAAIRSQIPGGHVVILANREPYIHMHKPGSEEIEVIWPASGMVTALEPIMRACSGTWVAHGSGNADREMVDSHDRVRVPPENPSYSLRRVWLSTEQEDGYYYGFSNEGLWPLCHLAHMRPIFRPADWAQYRAVNEIFADAVVAECSGDEPIILVQDYHFALAPRLIRQRKPRAIIITFWHVPWPNAEKFGICPWQNDILEGLLGSTIVGFHTRQHVNNFLDTVDGALESRIDRENRLIIHRGDSTLVRNYPISIEVPPESLSKTARPEVCREQIFQRHKLSSDALLGVGVERLDYTKGILERFWAIERFLEKYPQYIGRFTFIQIASPSRSRIPAYNRFADEVRILAGQINVKFSSGSQETIVLLERHHDPIEVNTYYRAARFCMVTSLHDGMNLVAKEFVAARDDDQGILLLSIFAGASRELPEALIVNPYDSDQVADAIARAASMSSTEQTERMRSMREQVRQNNVFRWASQLILDAAEQRDRARLTRRLEEAKQV